MASQKIGDFFRVSRSTKSSGRLKRLADDSLHAEVIAPEPKKPAHTRFAHLVHEPQDRTLSSDDVHPSEKLSAIQENKLPNETVAKTLALKGLRAPRTKADAFPTLDSESGVAEAEDTTTRTQNKDATKTTSRRLKNPQRQKIEKKTQNKRQPTRSKDLSFWLSTDNEDKATEDVTPITRQLAGKTEAATTPAPSPSITRPVDGKSRLTNSDITLTKPPVPSTYSCTQSAVRTKLRAFERFSHLAECTNASTHVELKTVAEAAETAEAASRIELTQTESAFPSGLTLPHNLRILLELFRSCDTVVSMLHNRSEICGFDKIKPAVQEIVRRNFEEKHVAQFLTIYPMVYTLHYEKQLDKYTRRPTGSYVLVLSPNLRSDGTQIGHDSPSKGHLVFTGTRLIQRRNRFYRLLLGLVMRAHREFLRNSLGIEPSQLPDDAELRRWHPRFPLETAVPLVQPVPLPLRPSDADHKITSAKEAVQAFQARALFREAEICQNVANNRMPSIPSPTKASALSPRKTNSQTCHTGNTPQKLPSVALFTSGPPANSVAANLKGVSQSLLAKVRARENERRMLTQLTRYDIPEGRRAIYSRLPEMVTHVWTVLRSCNGRPVPLTTVAARVANAHHSGLSPDAVIEHLNVLVELCPHWIEKLSWATPHLRMRTPEGPVKDVIDSLRLHFKNEGLNF
ncbi:unnamed protein product [Calicophoron daubneyi]|uniref:CDT1 Geminin-binding domain-containing protein n=1 Tax=Calicophoron daubneyi TaxID=300641 RepID=A0AAV2TLL7_CALDB